MEYTVSAYFSLIVTLKGILRLRPLYVYPLVDDSIEIDINLLTLKLLLSVLVVLAQNVNKVETNQLVHKPTGIQIQCSETRSTR
jgi:protein subunit release factor A